MSYPDAATAVIDSIERDHIGPFWLDHVEQDALATNYYNALWDVDCGLSYLGPYNHL